MDMSLADLQKSTPARRTKREIAEADLDELSQEQLEELAWEAMEKESKLKERVKRSTRISKESLNTEDPMKHITIRRKSNSPRKAIEQEALLLPLPKADTTGMMIRHTYDRQASPTRSAMKRPHARKSVAFGVVAEFEISREGNGLFRESAAIGVVQTDGSERSSSSVVVESSDNRSSSPLGRFNSTIHPLPLVKTTKGPVLTRRSSLRSAVASSSSKDNRTEVASTRKIASMSSPKNPVARTRLQSAVQESSVRARAKARESAIKAKAKAKADTEIPNGYRLSSTGTLVAQTKCNPFVAASKPLASVRSSSRRFSNSDKASQIKANPVPAWLKKRKDALLKEEDDRLLKELDRVRAEELGQKEERTGSGPQKRAKRTKADDCQKTAYTSAVEKRIGERAIWEAKRKMKEELLAQEKEQARIERTLREEEEYRQARQKSIPRANPVPEWLRTRAAKR
jgi:hypothetical protein